VSPIAATAVATQKSIRLMRAHRTSSGMLTSPATAVKTIAASVASGSRLSTGARKSATATASATVVSVASWDRAPAPWFTALCENPPAAGMAEKNAPTVFAAPVAKSSWSLSICGSVA